MIDFASKAKQFNDAESMAAAFLAAYFGNEVVSFPISPFKMLNDAGIPFVIRGFEKLEGVYIPAQLNDDLPIVGISSNRPITRQRFTAAHELCHHFRDADSEIACPIGQKNTSEKFADAFASAVLMPIGELRLKVNEFKDASGNVNFEDILKIAEYFGVSFEACVYRIAYKIHSIDGDIESRALGKRIRKFHPDNQRKMLGMTYSELYADLIDNYYKQLKFSPNDFARNVFEGDYIYNDSRMEGLEISVEGASEIVSDLRNKCQKSAYCTQEHVAFLSIAGHYKMYQSIFELPVKESLSVYDILRLNKDLFAYYPYPEFGGNLRNNNIVVSGAKFEAVDYHDIFNELAKVDEEIKEYFLNRRNVSTSEYVKHIARVHHRITMIHPFPEGNGRTSRAFMNVELIRSGLSPIYIKVEEKNNYIEALEIADTEKKYEPLYEAIFKNMIRTHVELNSQPL